MIDTFVILSTTALCIVVMLRAIRRDGRMPWFGSGPSGPGPALSVDDPDAP